MPRPIDKDLRDCLERANPYTEYRIEISQPDVSQVLRRTDQFTQAPSLVSMTPANSLAASARGALILAPAVGALASFPGVLSSYDLNGESPQRRVKGVAWTMDKAFSRVTLKSIQAKVQRVALGGLYFEADFECQVFRITKTPGVKQANVGTPQYQSIAWTEYTFTPLLTPAPTLKASAQAWDGSQIATLNFDLTNWNLTLDNSPAKAVGPDQVGELPEYLIVVRLAGKPPAGTGHFRWLVDNASARTIANIGTFERVWWNRSSDQDQWVRTSFADVPNITVNVENYPATGQGVYFIDQGKAPGATSTGRVDFQRSLPPGTSATLEISTAGAGGPWTSVKHGDVVATRQQTYHLRVTLNADSALRATPQINSMGIEFRIPQDVSVEGIPELPTREIDLPWPKASIPEGRIRVVRAGIRDYLDVASVIGSTSPVPRLEADIFLASRHPSITRDKWLRLERMLISNRVPSATSEEFTLVSYATRLKRKIPQKVETINSVHTVLAGTTAAQVIVSPALPGTTVPGNEYDGKGYYMRVRTTAAPNTPAGLPVTIQGNTSTDRLDFSPSMTEALVAGDVIEVHSGIFQTAAVSWVDADPADVWDGLLALVPIPPERIGAGWLPRGGKPPRVTDIAPGDAATQAKLKITVRVSEEEPADELLDQVSAILGGVTLEIDGQIVFVQIFPLVDINGATTIPLPPPAAVFDSRDFGSLATPPGLEKRATIVTCKYGVPATAAAPDAFPQKSTTSVDQDALLWLAQDDLEDYGTTDVDDKITRWLYNSADAGLYLAATIGTRLCKATSTGLRIFPMGMSEKHPDLVPGDVVIISTDQYTDYDPASQTPIVGPIAIRGVIVRGGREGRDLGIFIPGLFDNVQLVKGGGAGSLIGLGTITNPPIVNGSYSPSGELILAIDGDVNTSYFKFAISSNHIPTDVETRAGTQVNGQSLSGYSTGVFIAPGHPLFISVFAYSATGVESAPLASRQIVRQGGAFDPFHKTPHPIHEEERHRGHGGGYGVPGQRFHGEPYMDDTGGIPLLDPVARRVGAQLQANDGEPGIESQRAATRKGARATGHGAHGIVEEEHHRAGIGGLPVPGGRVHTLPVMDSSGGIPLIDTLTRKAQAALLGPAGTGMDVVEDGGNRSVAALEVGGIVAQGTTQRNGTSPKNIASGRYTIGTGVHGATITFPTNYQNPPAVNILGGISYEPASVWSTNPNSLPGALAPAAARQIDEVVAYNVTASGATLRARLRQASTSTPQSNAYAAGQITTNGGTLEATTANAPAANDTYTTDFTVQFTSTAPAGKACSVSGDVCLDYWNGSVWTQVASRTYTASDPVGGAADTGLLSDTIVATVSGLTSTSKFRLRLVTNSGAGSRTYSVDPGNVAYSTAAGDQYASKTPSGLGINLSVEVIGAS